MVTNASGTVAKSYSFDPWGAPRNAATWVSDLSEWPGYQGDRGFTGHEMLASLELVHMNARIYDPALGRFLSADPIIQAEGDLQNYNRYSYVLNNPLKYTDPSGHIFGEIFSAIFGILKALFTAIKPYIQAIIGFAEAKPLLFGAILGGTLGGVQGGFRGAIRGGFFGALSAGIAQGVGNVFDDLAKGGFTELARSLAHGVTQGALSAAQGGDFGAGFYSAAFASAAGSVMGKTNWGKATFRYRHNRVIAAAIVGGTASELAGGKFANGAVTAAMVQLFNAEAEGANEGPNLPDPNQKPPEWDPDTWKTGEDSRGPHWVSPKGEKWYPHPEDAGHWPHYDDSRNRKYPGKFGKPRPGQKRLKPYQSWDNPWPALGSDTARSLSTGQKIAVGAAAAGTGYLIYRSIRMIPSLAPPLWWTIPANLATP